MIHAGQHVSVWDELQTPVSNLSALSAFNVFDLRGPTLFLQLLFKSKLGVSFKVQHFFRLLNARRATNSAACYEAALHRGQHHRGGGQPTVFTQFLPGSHVFLCVSVFVQELGVILPTQ